MFFQKLEFVVNSGVDTGVISDAILVCLYFISNRQILGVYFNVKGFLFLIAHYFNDINTSLVRYKYQIQYEVVHCYYSRVYRSQSQVTVIMGLFSLYEIPWNL